MMAGRDRKNSIKALFGGDILPAGGEVAPETKSMPAGSEPPRAASGAVKAMGLSLSSITREAEEARALRQALQEGERIVALDTDRIDASFVSDRLSDEERDDPDFLALVESIRESGQQVPILVRPAPQDASGTAGEGSERYQVAYGHRRLRAARRLGQPVRAIVKALSDDELILAQGKENAERRNLSFIERALFAHALVGRGFERKLICDALAVQKSELSRLLQVAEAVPFRFARAIGPAPKAGRERWMALGALFQNGNGAEIEKAEDETGAERFLRAPSDERFQMLFDRLMRYPDKAAPEGEALTRPDGRVFARVERKGKAVRIAFAPDVEPAFIAALTARMRDDYAAFLAAGNGEKAGKD